ASRERPDFLVFMRIKVNGLQRVIHPLRPLFLVHKVPDDGHIMEKVFGGEVFIHPKLLRQIADQSLQLFPLFLDVDPVDEDLSVTGFEKSADDAHERRFACAVRAQEAKHAMADVECGAFEGFERLLLFANHGNRQDKPEKAFPDSLKPAGKPGDVYIIFMKFNGGDLDQNQEVPNYSQDYDQADELKPAV